ncbi:hypothetical protein PS681_01222 [Pseudomonas fluorescens]|nr:hypothetical protein PS681_01222 [Pseudomonas fluorescens]
MPPTTESITASVRNWRRMSRWRAPVAMRMPISRVRSRTVMSMMFITPMPPTSSEIAAIEPSISDRVFCVRASAWIIAALLVSSKSFLPLCRFSINCSMACSVSLTLRASAAAMATYSGLRVPNNLTLAAE